MKPLISECAKWLEEHEAPVDVLGVLRGLHPGSLSKNVRMVRREWIQTYGAGQNDGALRRDLRRVLKTIKEHDKSLAKTKNTRERKKVFG